MVQQTERFAHVLLNRVLGYIHFPGNFPVRQFLFASQFEHLPASGYTTAGFWNGPLWDGKTFRQAKNVSNMYKDRDPRFYASINFQYTFWDSANHRRPLKYAYFGNNGGASDGWPKSGTNAETGYNWRKWCDPNVNLRGSGSANRNFPIIRLADIYLIYAEAMNEYLNAPDQSVFDAINKVRTRVSMPALPVRQQMIIRRKECASGSGMNGV
jgi:starch-binding outer membrane protein, SusD/RagB family